MSFDDKPKEVAAATTTADETVSPLLLEFTAGLFKPQPSGIQLADARVGTQNNPYVAEDTTVAQNAPRTGTDTPVRAQPAQDGAGCPRSIAYGRFIDTANDLYYLPRSLNVEAIRDKYNCLIKTDADAVRFAKEEIAKIGDPHTMVKLASEVVRSQPQYTGVDARFQFEAGLLTNGLSVAEVKPGSAAAKSGLQSGDKIVKAAGTDIRGLEFDAAMLKLRGEKTSPLDVEVMRGGQLVTLRLQRPEKDFPMNDRMLDARTAYIKINDFRDEDLSDQLFAALQRNDKAEAIILDLRGNPGGRVDEAVEVAGFFMREGTVMRTRERIKGQDGYNIVEHKLDAKNITKFKTAPGQEPVIEGQPKLRTMYMAGGKQVIVLTDGRSASASEILSGALQDSGSAMVVGTPTFGKGIGQVWIRNLPAGSELYVTNFRYETPKGRWPGDGVQNSPDRYGLKPDYMVQATPGTIFGTSRDLQLAAAMMFVRPPGRRTK